MPLQGAASPGLGLGCPLPCFWPWVFGWVLHPLVGIWWAAEGGLLGDPKPYSPGFLASEAVSTQAGGMVPGVGWC